MPHSSVAHLQEACHINTSLFSLSDTIRTLSEGTQKFVDYRKSEITKLLRDSLGGNARTTVIVNAHPDAK